MSDFLSNVGSWIDNNVIKPVAKWVDNDFIQPAKRAFGIDQVENKIEQAKNNIIQGEIGQTVAKVGNSITTPIANAIGIKEPLPMDLEQALGKKTPNEVIDDMTVKGSLGEKIMNIAKMPTEIAGTIADDIQSNTEKAQGITDKETPTETEIKQESGNTDLEKLWEREDKIRKETQEREDTAYQRAVADMRKAGINPELVGIQPAQSGGGIISATGQNVLSTEMNNIVQQTLNAINNDVKMSENEKERTTDILRTMAMAILLRR